jgi:lysyl-tRNA synthetase class 1
MSLQTPSEIAAVLSAFDVRIDTFTVHDVERAVQNAVKDRNALSADARRGGWAEWAAFGFGVRDVPNGGPWGTHFQPSMSGNNGGTAFYVPDLREADAETIAYWAGRAKSAKHPVLVARYADLVWDTTEFVTKAKRGRDGIDFARLAIDNYIAASVLDNGSAWGDTRFSLGRALELALRVKDTERIGAAVKASIDYVDRTAKDEKLGTYCYLFDNLLPAERGPALTDEQENSIIEMFESKLAEMTTPGGGWDVEPHGPRDVGIRLAAYYQRKGKAEERTRVLRTVAQAFERRSKIGEPMTGLMFLEDARKYYVEAGLKEEAERVQHEAEKMGPEAEKRLVRTSVKHEIPKAEVDKFLDGMMEGGMEDALRRLALNFIPDQGEIAKHMEEVAKEHPLYAMFFGRAKMLGHGRIEADVGDETGDPDGKMVHETRQHIQFHTYWIAWALDRMVRDGLAAAQFVGFLRPCLLFKEDRIPLIRRGVEAHFMGDYTQAIHLLIPQIERALVLVPPLAGKPSNKPHRTGRGVMQSKSLNDILAKDEWPVPGDGGENLRMYLLTALAHPKGLNIRNDVCHGLWSPSHFTRIASERVLHVLLAVSMLRPSRESERQVVSRPKPSKKAVTRSDSLKPKRKPPKKHDALKKAAKKKPGGKKS